MSLVRKAFNIIAACLILLIGYYLGLREVRFYRVTSASMEPTLRADDRLITVRADRLRRGDIVMLRDPRGGRDILGKRVVGLPGDRIVMTEGELRVNGEPAREPYLAERASYSLEAEVPPGECFVLGDNRNASEDSSSWGPVPVENITGRVVCRYWPRDRFALFAR